MPEANEDWNEEPLTPLRLQRALSLLAQAQISHVVHHNLPELIVFKFFSELLVQFCQPQGCFESPFVDHVVVALERSIVLS